MGTLSSRAQLENNLISRLYYSIECRTFLNISASGELREYNSALLITLLNGLCQYYPRHRTPISSISAPRCHINSSTILSRTNATKRENKHTPQTTPQARRHPQVQFNRPINPRSYASPHDWLPGNEGRASSSRPKTWSARTGYRTGQGCGRSPCLCILVSCCFHRVGRGVRYGTPLSTPRRW
jgi:hypothetical protein